MSTREPMPEHVRRYLELIGRIDADGITRKARIRFCNKCHAITIRGLDHNRCADTAIVDPAPLTVVSELEALLAGRSTYELNAAEGYYRIDVRWSWHIAGHPAGMTNGDVVAEHKCPGTAPSSTLPSRIPPLRVLTSKEPSCPPY
jgi:hypothetical protein